MIDKSIFEKYIVPLKDIDIQILNNRTKKRTPEVLVNEYIVIWLDATKITPDGRFHVTQTIDYPYKSALTECLYIIENFVEDKDKYMYLLYKRHNDNLEFEKENPPIIYDKNKAKPKRKVSNKKVNETSLPGFETPRRESAAERKLKEKIFKINSLKFKI